MLGLVRLNCFMAYQHIVLFRFTTNATPTDISRVITAFAALPTALPAIQSFMHGNNISPENLAQGYTHCFQMSFATQTDFLEAYFHETAHQEFVASLEGLVEQALVFDFTST